ncbi:MAG TPA: Os1348 family NHLP clan protein [Thermoanaerobaculia bacterium]|nr:Os1348 family NHLP clan protein [Thermoanaerobaculia bacterium]
MTQKNVELVIGRLVTDEEFRRLFERDPAAALETLAVTGLELNRVERQELLSLDAEAFEVLAPTVSPRLQRVGFTRPPEDENGRSS